MPAWPAYFFLAISIPLLVPVWGARLPERFPGAAAGRALAAPRAHPGRDPARHPADRLGAAPAVEGPGRGEAAAAVALPPRRPGRRPRRRPGRGRARPHLGRAEAALRGLLLHRLPLTARVHAVRGRPSRDPPGEALRADRTCAALHDRDGRRSGARARRGSSTGSAPGSGRTGSGPRRTGWTTRVAATRS